MTATSDDILDGWSLDFAEDVDLPGWVPLPTRLSAEEEDLFVSEVTRLLGELMSETQPDGPPPFEGQLQALVREGLATRAGSDSSFVYQVWPVAGPYYVLCHVNFVRSVDLPDWADLPGTLHHADARHIGPGLQYSARRVVQDAAGDPLDVSAVHLVFADDDFGVMVSLHEASSALISQALEGFGLFKNALTLSRGDGSTFTSKPPVGMIADEEWSADDDGKS